MRASSKNAVFGAMRHSWKRHKNRSDRRGTSFFWWPRAIPHVTSTDHAHTLTCAFAYTFAYAHEAVHVFQENQKMSATPLLLLSLRRMLLTKELQYIHTFKILKKRSFTRAPLTSLTYALAKRLKSCKPFPAFEDALSLAHNKVEKTTRNQDTKKRIKTRIIRQQLRPGQNLRKIIKEIPNKTFSDIAVEDEKLAKDKKLLGLRSSRHWSIWIHSPKSFLTPLFDATPVVPPANDIKEAHSCTPKKLEGGTFFHL